MYLLDKLSSRRFLVDSSASVSVFPAPSSTSTSGVKLITADRSTLVVQVPESCLYVLVPAVLSGFFSWLLSPFRSSGRTFSAITIFSWTGPTRRFSAALLLPYALPLLLCSLLISKLISSPPQSVSQTFSPNFLTFSPLMVLQLLHLTTRLATIFSHTPDPLFLPNLATWISINLPLQR